MEMPLSDPLVRQDSPVRVQADLVAIVYVER
jgi:hypothetical protein